MDHSGQRVPVAGSSRKWCISENPHHFFSDGTRVPIAARQSVHCVPVIARALRRIKAEGTHKERPQTRIALAQKRYTSAATETSSVQLYDR